ncbi:TauD/TfdA family dioxygenase [Mycobacterium interjectum]|uniref:TauD/TfdA family dioxygenase n=1 Tax=Mycobacterium interjectum TaxID=33895 RepID=UPI00083507AE|nr:TauD/TfdA family dioxygenase [Mycobacterium interjectum]MCV7089121.1 TauD/TfdA family dioxygenase [Mycobacterium interjectum]
MPTAIYTEPVTDSMAWTGADFTSKEDFAFDLSARNVAALESILAKTANKDRDDITAEDARHPDLDEDLARLYQELMFGKGLACVRGFPVEQHSIEDLERIYWAFCTHLGYLVSNNSFGHRMVRVQEEILPGGVQPARGTKSRAELAMHNDAADILSLLCVYPAAQGGESQFASGPAAHNRVLAERPDLLDVLYRGFPHHRRSEQPDDQPDVTPYDVPIFSQIDGRICINFTYSSILPAMHALGREFTAEETEAVELLRNILVEQQVEFRLESGEAAVANNFAMCHSRSDFVSSNDPKKARCFLRAWMEVPREDRRLPIGREYFHMENKDLRLGYDVVEGRDGAIARNDYKNVNAELAEMFKAAQAKPKVNNT